MLRFRTHWSYSAPALADVIGSTRDTQALPALYLGAIEPYDQSPSGSFGEARFAARLFGPGAGSLLGMADDATPEDLQLLARSLDREADHVARIDHSLRGQRTVDSWRSASMYLQRVSKLPKFDSPRKRGSLLAEEHLTRAAWAIENDLARCVTVKMLNFDTHSNNVELQRKHSSLFMPLFLRFLERLAQTRNEHGSLLDQTMIVVGSELGRFPRLNSAKGKDHFPEADYMLVGSGFNAGRGEGITFGGSDRDLASVPVSPSTGAVAKYGIEPTLDDLGTTLVQLAGVDPRHFGYSGRYLDFLTPQGAA